MRGYRRLFTVVLLTLVGSCASDRDKSAPPSVPDQAAQATGDDVAAVVVPRAVCLGNSGELFFGYDNSSSTPLVIAEGSTNSLSGADPNDNPLLTTLFAPGSVDAAFWAYNGDDGPVTWTLAGPDGISRTATADATLPACPANYPDSSTADDREPTIEVVGSELNDDQSAAIVELRLAGIPETSVCSAAFEAEPVLAGIGDGTTLPTGFEPTVSLTVEPFGPSIAGGQLATARVYALVVDQCRVGDVIVSSWSPAPAVRALTFGMQVCARLDDAGALSVELTLGLCDLGVTGGTSIRPK
ncbi:MAG: hypothetical protein ABIR32_04125 [Ilumatobacteraceae bacterium]